MDIFLNEQSLHAQFADANGLVSAVVVINRLLFRVSELTSDRRVFFDPQIYLRPAIVDHMFSSCLKSLPDRDARLQFKILLQKCSASSWREDPAQECCDYRHNHSKVTDTSIAEAAERVLRGGRGLLLNFLPSSFDDATSISVVKAQSDEVSIGSISSEPHLDQWIALFPEYGGPTFDPACGRTPLDTETVLRDRGRFTKTKLNNQGRVVYLEVKTGYRFCVDNLHVFGAHLEIFDARGGHIGESTLNGEIDFSKADSTKDLPQ